MPDQSPTPATIPEGKISLNKTPAAPVVTPAVEGPAPLVIPPETPAVVPPPEVPAVEPEGEDVLPAEEPAPAGPEDVEAQLEFFQELDRLHGGDPLEVDYGTTAPSSLEGMLLRERAIEQRAYEAFESRLKETDPRSVAYMMHRAKGGTDEEFFSRRSSVLPDLESFKENISLKKQVYKDELTSKGLSDEHADILIKSAEDKGTLDAEAEAAYNRRLVSDRAEMEALEKQALEEDKIFRTKVKEVDTAIESAVNSTALGLVIPDKEKVPFLAFMKQHVQTDGEKFFVAQEIQKDSVERLTEALYLQFKKGDLSSIIQRRANTLNVKRNQLTLGKTRQSATAPPPADTTPRKKTLGELNFAPQLPKP
jgi:hypothetical protein